VKVTQTWKETGLYYHTHILLEVVNFVGVHNSSHLHHYVVYGQLKSILQLLQIMISYLQSADKEINIICSSICNFKQKYIKKSMNF
jgi:hypothetical protein